MLKPEAEMKATAEADIVETGHDSPGDGKKTEHTAEPQGGIGSNEDAEYVKLNNQFVVPVVNDDRVDALVVMSLSLELEPGQRETVYAREPKLRDVFLQVLFDHANMGGFQGNFTSGSNLEILRKSLTEAAQNILGPIVKGVLIFDLARQDV